MNKHHERGEGGGGMNRVQFKWDRCVSLIFTKFVYVCLSNSFHTKLQMSRILISARLNIFKSAIGVKSNEPYNLK